MPRKCVIPASFSIKLELPHQMTEVVNPFLPSYSTEQNSIKCLYLYTGNCRSLALHPDESFRKLHDILIYMNGYILCGLDLFLNILVFVLTNLI